MQKILGAPPFDLFHTPKLSNSYEFQEIPKATKSGTTYGEYKRSRIDKRHGSDAGFDDNYNGKKQKIDDGWDTTELDTNTNSSVSKDNGWDNAVTTSNNNYNNDRGSGNREYRGRGRGNGEYRGRGRNNGEYRGRGGGRGRYNNNNNNSYSRNDYSSANVATVENDGWDDVEPTSTSSVVTNNKNNETKSQKSSGDSQVESWDDDGDNIDANTQVQTKKVILNDVKQEEPLEIPLPDDWD